ncbi:phosphodiester glycosidase family protein [Priestia flexa]|uniref:phosphodiester glycosidase family protein n=1 Tax=Priestia flexa TaxID=86664 RepID=UPI001A8D844C|nr:phosphodiester glycosidase family protein [Priestia flexa]MBN8436417.1 phosphodiester glycosidase family protein [Priestia flexa]MCA0968950.1 phosphodiester glycosidase family protein [Priestia flexa]
MKKVLLSIFGIFLALSFSLTSAQAASNYTFKDVRNPDNPYNATDFYVIRTLASNIKSEVIKKPVSSSGYMGINGGLFSSSCYSCTPSGRSISYYSGAKNNYNYNGTSSKQITRPTYVTYYDKKSKQTKVKILKFKNMSQITNDFKKYPNQQIKTAIGGVRYSVSDWGSKAYYAPARRTVLGFKEEKGKTYAYLVISKPMVTIPQLQRKLSRIGLNDKNSIMLDGSGSSSMRVKNGSKWFIDKGTETTSGKTANRHVFNMVRLINTN